MTLEELLGALPKVSQVAFEIEGDYIVARGLDREQHVRLKELGFLFHWQSKEWRRYVRRWEKDCDVASLKNSKLSSKGR